MAQQKLLECYEMIRDFRDKFGLEERKDLMLIVINENERPTFVSNIYCAILYLIKEGWFSKDLRLKFIQILAGQKRKSFYDLLMIVQRHSYYDELSFDERSIVKLKLKIDDVSNDLERKNTEIANLRKQVNFEMELKENLREGLLESQKEVEQLRSELNKFVVKG